MLWKVCIGTASRGRMYGRVRERETDSEARVSVRLPDR